MRFQKIIDAAEERYHRGRGLACAERFDQDQPAARTNYPVHLIQCAPELVLPVIRVPDRDLQEGPAFDGEIRPARTDRHPAAVGQRQGNVLPAMQALVFPGLPQHGGGEIKGMQLFY